MSATNTIVQRPDVDYRLIYLRIAAKQRDMSIKTDDGR